jgi:hypothetical protein
MMGLAEVQAPLWNRCARPLPHGDPKPFGCDAPPAESAQSQNKRKRRPRSGGVVNPTAEVARTQGREVDGSTNPGRTELERPSQVPVNEAYGSPRVLIHAQDAGSAAKANRFEMIEQGALQESTVLPAAHHADCHLGIKPVGVNRRVMPPEVIISAESIRCPHRVIHPSQRPQ